MPFENIIPWLSIVIAYLLGSIPTSFIIGKVFYKTDIRNSGSGNTGATNTLRTLGTKAGIIVLLVDILKGVAAVFIGKAMGQSLQMIGSINALVSLCGFAAIMGHIFSVFIGFRGGKGVATAGGVFLALSPFSLALCLILFIFVVYSTRYVSLGSILAAFAFMFIELVYQLIMKFPNLPQLVLTIVVVLMIIFRHRSNIKRLMEGSENKFGQKTPRKA